MLNDQKYKPLVLNEDVICRYFIGDPDSSLGDNSSPTSTVVNAEAEAGVPETPNAQAPQLDITDAHSSLYCYIYYGDKSDNFSHIECEMNDQAKLGKRSIVPRSNEAFRQNWKIVLFPNFDFCLLQTAGGTFLRVLTNGIAKTVHSAAGLTTEDCFWELLRQESNPPYKYKIFNIRTQDYLKKNGSTLELTPLPNDATIWDFEISGTIPPP